MVAASKIDDRSSVSSVEEIEAALRPVAEVEPRLLGLYLFGSRADGTAHEASDVDLGALFSEPLEIFELLALEDRFERALGGCRVQLLDAGRTPPFLALDIIRGERIYEADGEACDLFDLYVMRRAGDLAPFERMRREMLTRAAKGVA